MTDISFSVSGSTVRGKLFSPSASGPLVPAVLFLHGWTSGQDRYVDLGNALSEIGSVGMTFDMRGHGISDGDLETLSRTDFLEDVVAAYDFLKQLEEVDASMITVVGSSFGAYLATLLCAKRPCRAIALRAPADYPDRGFDEPHLLRATSYYEGAVEEGPLKWKSTVHPYTETASLRAIHEFAGRVLIIESGNDQLVPHEIPQSYAEAVSNSQQLTYIVMEGAPHGLSKDEKRQKELQGILLDWIQTQ